MLLLLRACAAPDSNDAAEADARASDPWAEVSVELAEAYDEALSDGFAELGPPGAAMAISDTIGSVTKTFTASLVFARHG